MNSFKMHSDHPWSKDIPGFVRELGSMERMMKIVNDEESILLCNVLFILSKDPITDGIIRAALSRVVIRIPNLKLKIVNHLPDPTKPPVPVFAEMNPPVIPLGTSDEEDWRTQLSKEWKIKYDVSEGPLWRVTHLPRASSERSEELFPFETVIIFSFHHSIIDGMSYQWLFSEFLDALEAVKAGDTDGPSPGRHGYPIEHYLEGQDGIMASILKTAMRLLTTSSWGQWLMKRLVHLQGKNLYLKKFRLPIDDDADCPVEASLIPLEFSRDETAQVLRACKGRKVTVNGAAYAAATIALALVLQDGQLTTKCKVQTSCAASMRRLSKELNPVSFGDYSSLLEIAATIPAGAAENPDTFWEVARFFTDKVRQLLDQKTYINDLLFMSAVLPAFEAGVLRLSDMTSERYKRGTSAVLVTNMGRCSFLERTNDANFKLAARFGGGSEHKFGGIFTSNIVTFNSKIYWSIVYSKHIVPTTRAEQYVDFIHELLIKFSKPE